MNKQQNTSSSNLRRIEQGQALVLIVLAAVGLMGFAALAVDLGRVYAERRRAQNAVDAAAMAWAYADSQLDYGGTYTLSDVQNAIPAYNTLAENAYTNVPGRVSIQVFWPPASGPYGPDSGLPEEKRNEYVQVVLQTRVDQVFSQFIFSGSQTLTVEAVAHVVPSRSISPGNALMATQHDICPGIVFNGGANTHIVGGNIFSNSGASSATGGTGNCHSAITTGSSGNIRVDGGDVLVAGDFRNQAGASIVPPPQHTDYQDLPAVPLPDCGGLLARSQGSSSTPLEPGIYSEIVIHNGDWTMKPGMYCFNGDFTVNGGSLRGDGVIIVMNHGSISFSGNADIHLKRPSDYVDASGHHWGGMLIYMPASNHGGIDLAGNNGTSYMGTIYAPGPRDPASQEKCNIGGANTSIGVRANVMCSTVGIAGNSSVTINYREEENFRMQPTVELSQ